VLRSQRHQRVAVLRYLEQMCKLLMATASFCAAISSAIEFIGGSGGGPERVRVRKRNQKIANSAAMAALPIEIALTTKQKGKVAAAPVSDHEGGRRGRLAGSRRPTFTYSGHAATGVANVA
jgi:hypothetical protein